MLENELVFDLEKFGLDFSMNYEYVSDPPVFADFGLCSLLLKNISAYFDAIPVFVEEDGWDTFSLDLLPTTYISKGGFGPLKMEFDGISDISILATQIATNVLNLLFNRVQSLITYYLDSNIEPLVNKILAFIPLTFKGLGASDLWVTLFLNENIEIKN